MKVVTVEEMRHIEAASDAAGHSYAAMMERAGRAVAEAVVRQVGVAGRAVLVLVGPGNNGGDGLVAARHLAEHGAAVTCYLLRPRDPSADENFRLVQERGIAVVLAADDPQRVQLRRLAAEAEVVLDALLGTGARPPLRGTAAAVLREVGAVVAARRQAAPRLTLTRLTMPSPTGPRRPLVVAVDGPSGLDYESGALDEAALPADLTVTFAYPKRGHFRFPGAGALGDLIVADIGTDPALAADIALEVADPEMVRRLLPPRPPDGHKGTFGKAMIVAGSVNYTGAAYLAGAAATKAGAGLVTLALPTAIHAPVAAHLAEATYLPLPHAQGVIAPPAADLVGERSVGYDALLIGPGLGRTPETRTFVERVLSRAALPPLVVDADGLNILSELEDWPARLPPGTVLTPHPGEMARLMGVRTGAVQGDRLAVARGQAAAWGHFVVLKGAHTVVAAPDGRAVIEPFANPGLATAGTGDVLAGTIVALLAQGVEPFEAAVAGAYLHGLAGELARELVGAAGMTAGDVLEHLPHAWHLLDVGHRPAGRLAS